MSEVQPGPKEGQRKSISDEARDVERETATSALAQRMAANLWTWILYLLGVPAVVLATSAGASALKDQKGLAAGLALGAAIASGMTTFLKPGEQAERHRSSSTAYRSIENEARDFWKVECSGDEPTEKLRRRLASLITQWNQENDKAPHVVSSLYQKAKGKVADDPKYRSVS